MIDDDRSRRPPVNRLLALTRGCEAKPIGWVRSGQVYRAIRPFLAPDLRLDHPDRGEPEMRLFVSSTQFGGYSYTRLATSIAGLREAIATVLAGQDCAPEDVVLIEDDGGMILRITRGELRPRREPNLGDWHAEGVARLAVWCGRCRRRADHDLVWLIGERGAGHEIGELAASFTEGCPWRRAGQYRRCRPKVERIDL